MRPVNRDSLEQRGHLPVTRRRAASATFTAVARPVTCIHHPATSAFHAIVGAHAEAGVVVAIAHPAARHLHGDACAVHTHTVGGAHSILGVARILKLYKTKACQRPRPSAVLRVGYLDVATDQPAMLEENVLQFAGANVHGETADKELHGDSWISVSRCVFGRGDAPAKSKRKREPDKDVNKIRVAEKTTIPRVENKLQVNI
ncbi:hypothetical protein THASP1DRAFT_21461 [Thamnocephalis sphaerospora]|uniref:Uncharacterized protein n=1 Tax=Thamnocephalis sphaerospora TaxID=78915 RepID=A0A4P9XYX0_9FUNG|nr:hypothetical protein THASP1DRAFT_21461 [Thamnocephalis sphaerospora]|eukprot:RKP10911.1 hypothetical protein THASP1DRAFT_21461 [Thamnocephalis sphaerospora]